MRLHKYNPIFGHMRWQDIISLNDQELQAKGVAALGARRKMLKVFDNVKEYCRENVKLKIQIYSIIVNNSINRESMYNSKVESFLFNV